MTEANESKTIRIGSTSGRRTVQPLFPAWVHITLGVTAVFGVLLWLWPASAIRGWSFRLPSILAAICFLSFYVSGELIRWRFRISLRNLFALVALLAVLSGGFGTWLLEAHQQRSRVLVARRLGGYVGYDTIHGLDGKVITSEGWVVPQKLVDTFGLDVFARTKEVGWFNGGISDEALSTLDLQGFSSVAVCSHEVGDTGLQHVCRNPEVTQLSLSTTRVTDDGLRALQNLPKLQYLNLWNTNITDQCLPHVQSLNNLIFVNLKGTQLTPEGIEAFRRTLPGCQVLSDFDK